MRVLLNECMNRHLRMLDGQWQGITLASDGNVYFFAGSHRPDLGAPFFRYVPDARGVGRIELISRNMSEVCGENLKRVPAQGKVHSEVLEHEGWLENIARQAGFDVSAWEGITEPTLVPRMAGREEGRRW